MNETKYYCDRCKKEIPRGEITYVRLELDPYSTYKTKRFDKVYQTLDLCDTCAEKLGFMLKKVDKQEQTVVEPTTAEKLYELIANIIMEVGR